MSNFEVRKTKRIEIKDENDVQKKRRKEVITLSKTGNKIPAWISFMFECFLEKHADVLNFLELKSIMQK